MATAALGSSPELAPPFIGFCFFGGSLCFPLTRQHVDVCWRPHSGLAILKQSEAMDSVTFPFSFTGFGDVWCEGPGRGHRGICFELYIAVSIGVLLVALLNKNRWRFQSVYLVVFSHPGIFIYFSKDTYDLEKPVGRGDIYTPYAGVQAGHHDDQRWGSYTRCFPFRMVIQIPYSNMARSNSVKVTPGGW